jgi:tyrosine-protein phosphatase YwqE
MFFKSKYIPVSEFFPKGYVDIHSHFLPGIDDGAKNLDDSFYLIEQFIQFGIKNIITTPHILGSVWPNTPEIIQNKRDQVQAEIEKRKLDFTLRAAAEYMLDEKFGTFLEKRELMTLKDNYLLIEMSYLSPPSKLFEYIYEIQQAGYEPILAHPERYGFLHGNLKGYEKLKDHGCYFQLNLLSLTKQYGKFVTKTAKQLLEANFIDFVGSDTHHKGHINLYKQLATKKNHQLLSTIMENNIKTFS